MPEDGFLWGLFRWNGMRLHFTASGELPAACVIHELKIPVANDEH